ncbi:helix-turn-helix domain-containing protein [Altererythrobacter sp. C41]|uniref:helix-turn-helix domain-containing protein n=1 Tax=Altererythrobacter sp. C41 TaxID=2806021 RepID=UPI001932EBF6|nr:helix-turn-helix transcriptional regulator [Altererythrobacter sp. C41]MBM0168496.1 helix-turn-helix transcriptional regulator [Altererythrobacter sp. C41]
MGEIAFSANLRLVLKALSMSRGRLASVLGVDKSLVGRWASGAVRPSSHNLERLTHLVAERQDGFTLLDWEREPAELADLLGVTVPHEAPKFVAPEVPGLATARMMTDLRGAAYEGFWRVTRPAVVAPGRFCHDHGFIRRGATGLLEFQLGNPDFRFVGWALPFEGQLFCVASDPFGTMPSFLVVNGVPMPKADLLDGIILTAFNALRLPAAYPIILERIGDLSGDLEADDARAADLMAANDQFAAEGAVPDHIRDHLLRDIGPAAAASGGDMLLTASRTSVLSRQMSDEAETPA